jgi:hypothetical protein
MNDLQIVVNYKPGLITTNFPEIKATLQEQMQIYKELEVNEENKVERKKDVATLRKMQKAINDKKSDIRAKCLEPYDEFSKMASELVEIINEPISIIDSQVKEYEEKQRQAKKAEIKQIYEALIVNYHELIDNIGLVNIYDSKWENVATSMKSIREEMTEKLDKINNDVALIKSMRSEKTEDALNSYWVDLDVTKAVAIITRYEQQKKEIEERLKEQQRLERERELEFERQRIREEERRRIQEEERIREEERRKLAEVEEKIREEERLKTLTEIEAQERTQLEVLQIQEQSASSEIISETYLVTGTQKELEQVEMYMNSIGVSYTKF